MYRCSDRWEPIPWKFIGIAMNRRQSETGQSRQEVSLSRSRTQFRNRICILYHLWICMRHRYETEREIYRSARNTLRNLEGNICRPETRFETEREIYQSARNLLRNWGGNIYGSDRSSVHEMISGSVNQEITPPPFYGTWRFITVFTRASHLCLYWVTCNYKRLISKVILTLSL